MVATDERFPQGRAPRRMGRVRVLVAMAVVMVLLVGAVVVERAVTSDDAVGVERPVFDDAGNLAMAMPSLASTIELTPNDDGSSQLGFSLEFAVANLADTSQDAPASASTTAGAKADAAVVSVGVYPGLAPGGPVRMDPAFRQTVLDRQLDRSTTTRDYSVRITPDATAALRQLGFGSGDPAQEAAARRHVDIDVQHMRDFKVVDGEWDWQQGRAWTAADQPVAGADITDDSTITVENSTGDGVFSRPGLDGGTGPSANVVDDPETYASYLSLSGAPVECIDQGDGSNPQGFSTLNGWDIEQGLAPGMIPPGASVTQQVNANESLGTASLDTIEDWATISTQVTLAAFSLASPGLKTAISQAVLVSMGMADFSDPITAALAVPILAIAEMGDAIYTDMTATCASYANVFNLTAAEPFGGMASISWGDQTDGLQKNYMTASHEGTAVTDNVQLAASNGIVSYSQDGTTTTVHPWLTQEATTACGTGDPQGCPGAGNNVIQVAWSVEEPCPFDPSSDCTPSQSDMAAAPPITVPGTSLCGVDNELCPVVAAPNPSAAEVSTQDVADGSYEVVGQFQPERPVIGLAAVDDQSVFGATSEGTLYRFTVDPSAPAPAIDVVAALSVGITTITALDGEIVVTGADGELDLYDPADGSLTSLGQTAQPVVRAVEVGGLVYLATASSLYALTSDHQLDPVSVEWPGNGTEVTSMTAGSDLLFVGFTDGWVVRCSLTDCAGSWSVLHDGGFASAANAMAAVGDTLYVGLDNGAIAQIDGESGATTMLGEPGDDGLSWGGMATVDGNVFTGGCVGLQSPVSGDLLGVVVLDGIKVIDGVEHASYTPTAPDADSCRNPTETTTKYKGFDPSTYAMLATPATDGHAPLVFASFTIEAGSFVYALESVAPFTGELCLADDGPCPTATELAVAPSGAPAPGGSLSALGAPQVVSTCDDVPDDAYVAAGVDAPLSTPAGTQVTEGFALTPATSSSSACTTAFAWNLSNLGSFPYVLWQGNAYPDSGSPPPSLAFAGTGQAALDATAGGATLPAGSSQPLTDGGAQLSVDVTDAGALVLSLQTQAGEQAGTVTFTDDTLTSTGQPVPSPAPLEGGAPGAPPCRVGSSELASVAAAIYPLDDTTAVALDVSGNQNNGIISSPAGVDVTPGPSAACPGNGALELDGTSTTVTLPASLDRAVQGDALTAVAWVRTPEAPTGDNPRLISNAHTDMDGTGFELALQAGSGPMFSVGLPGQIVTVSGTEPLSAGEWHQVVGVYGAGTATVYVDGRAVGSSDAGDGEIVAAADQVALGYDPAYQGDFLSGQLADVAIVPAALTAEQVAALDSEVVAGDAGGGSPSSTSTTSSTSTVPPTGPSSTTSPSTTEPTTTTTAAPSSTTTTAPVPSTCTFVNASMAGGADALWLLADRDTTAVDASGHGHDATIVNAAAYDQAPGPATGCAGSGGLAFDGTSTHVVGPDTLGPATTGDALSVVAFVKVDPSASGPLVVVADDDPGTSGDGFSLSLAAGGDGATGGAFSVGATGGVATAEWTAPLAAGTWHQLVGTYDGTTVTAYLDGQVVATAATTGSVGPGAAPVSIGYDPIASSSFYDGLVADVAVVAQPLTGSQVAGMWTASQRYANAPATAGLAPGRGTGPLVWWLLPLLGAVTAGITRRRGVVGRR